MDVSWDTRIDRRRPPPPHSVTSHRSVAGRWPSHNVGRTKRQSRLHINDTHSRPSPRVLCVWRPTTPSAGDEPPGPGPGPKIAIDGHPSSSYSSKYQLAFGHSPPSGKKQKIFFHVPASRCLEFLICSGLSSAPQSGKKRGPAQDTPVACLILMADQGDNRRR